MATMRKYVGLIAAVLFLCFGVTLLISRSLLLGALFLLVGIVACFWQIRTLIRSREDPYDLSRLFDSPLPGEDKPEPDIDTAEDDDVPFCYHCGHAVSKPFARCPQCGASVR